ncbi:hypothetical protein BDY19DRAFT_139051 [Irpex rosettiformis]|uniref:Uncharacterized protein n=1 Tax=Irpex rosettiformis TaxID=378272 RepID=A0ACB8U5U3_9APHY|nr:hypothetical protein BDY19DRAFT_139051 [Irpex rosettiformis]
MFYERLLCSSISLTVMPTEVTLDSQANHKSDNPCTMTGPRTQPSLDGDSPQRLEFVVQLSDDVLHNIFDLCKPERHKEHENTWLACSLVCRQWHTVAVSYVFRSLSITSRHPPLHDYATFFKDTPHISRHISKINIHGIIIDIPVMHALLGLLPHLQDLNLSSVGFSNPDGVSKEQLQENNYALRRLHLEFFYFPPAEYDGFPDFLGLFAEIGEVNIGIEFALTEKVHSMVEKDVERKSDAAAAMAGNLGRPQCRALKLKNGLYASSFIPSFLLKVGGLHHLSSLSLAVMDDIGPLERLNELLCSTGSTLKFLCIDFCQGPRWFGYDKEWITTGATELLRTGLETCKTLESLEIKAEIMIELVWAISSESFLSYIYGEAFRSTVDLVSLVPGESLHALEFHLKLGQAHGGEYNCAHTLPWDEMRKACLRFSDLRSLRITLLMDSHYKKPCVAYEMQYFAEILTFSKVVCYVSGCEKAECKKFDADRHISMSNSVLPLSTYST